MNRLTSDGGESFLEIMRGAITARPPSPKKLAIARENTATRDMEELTHPTDTREVRRKRRVVVEMDGSTTVEQLFERYKDDYPVCVSTRFDIKGGCYEIELLKDQIVDHVPVRWCGMSNMHHTIEDGFAEALQARPNEVYGTYAARDFHGRVWWDGRDFCCEPWVFAEIQPIVRGKTLERLMRRTCDLHGWA